jgi:hypothetical protein
MPDQVMDFSHAVFAKTLLGQQEVQSRALKLGPVPRRLLILIDGKRSAQDLSHFLAGHNIEALISELLDKGCIESTTPLPEPDPRPVTESMPIPWIDLDAYPASLIEPLDAFLNQLPNASTRSAQDAESARNFMMNAVNTVFQTNTRLTLLETIFSCKTTQALRDVYPKWAATLGSSDLGAQYMPTFKQKLSEVL